MGPSAVPQRMTQAPSGSDWSNSGISIQLPLVTALSTAATCTSASANPSCGAGACGLRDKASALNGCKCGDTTISLYEGDRSDNRQGKRNLLNTFLKGSRNAKVILQRDHPELFSYFQEIWSVRNHHMVQ